MNRRKLIGRLALLMSMTGLSTSSLANLAGNSRKNSKTMKAKARSVHHIGIPIKNLDVSLKFYQDFLEGKVQFINEMIGQGFSDGVQVPNAKCRFAMLEIGNTIIELIEYTNPLGEPYTQSNNDLGAIHIAFEVDDIHAVYRKLQDGGVKFNAAPYTFKEEDKAADVIGATFAYFKDPDGIQLEIFEAAK